MLPLVTGALVAEDSLDGISIRGVVGVLQLKTTRTKKRISGHRDLIIAKPVIIIAVFCVY